MKLKKSLIVAIVAIVATFTANVHAFDLNSLKNAVTNGTVGNLIDGVISTDNVEVADLAGTWKVSGAAVSFKSDDLLKKAGGATTAALIENKVNPYYAKLGLNNATFTFDSKGNFTVTVKNGKKVTGTVTKGTTAGTLVFKFGKTGIAKVPAYVSKGTSLSIMFDASKLQTVISALSTATKNQTATQISSLLSSYKGVYVGFKMSK